MKNNILYILCSILLFSAICLKSRAQVITTYAGTGSAGYSGDGGPATAATMRAIEDIDCDACGNVYVADAGNNCIRRISSTGVITTFAGNGTSGYSGDGGPATAAELSYPTGVIVVGSGDVYIADYQNHRVRKVSTSGIITTVAGNGSSGFSGDGGPATAAQLNKPLNILLDPSGNLFISEGGNLRVRKVNTSGIITTIAGGGSSLGDGGPATAAQFSWPRSLAMDVAGNLYISDQYQARIRIINGSGIINTFAGTGAAGYSGDGGAASAAKINFQNSIQFDATGNLYIGDSHNEVTRVINASGIISTFAGTGGAAGYSGDGGPPTAARCNQPNGIAVGPSGEIFSSEFANNIVRRIGYAPIPLTVGPITGIFSLCTGDITTLSDTSASGTWSSSLPSVATISSSGIVTGLSAGMAIITYQVVRGCDSLMDTALVTVHDIPLLNINDTSMCAGSAITLTITGSASYTWSPSSTLSASIGSSVVASPAVTTVYTVTATDGFGCANSRAITVIVNAVPSGPGVTSPVNYCVSATAVPLTASGLGLRWYTSTTGGTGSTTAPVPSTATAGTTDYFVSQTVSSCESPRSMIVVNVTNNSMTGFTYNIHYGCAFDSVDFTNTSQYADKYRWSFGDGSIVDTNANPKHYYLPVNASTNYTVKLVGINNICLGDSTALVLTLLPGPRTVPIITGITPAQTIKFGESIQLDATGGFIYYWKPNDGSLDNPNINNPIATPSITTTYIVYAYNNSGCLDSAKVIINVDYTDIDFIPNAFTPNGDGQNDLFRISNLRYGKLVLFSIYNRWGQLVFQTNDITKGWDGRFNGEPQDMGVYNYLIIMGHTDGENKTYKGTVTLIR